MPTAMIELFDYVLSTDSYKARLFLSILGLPYVTRTVELYPAREHRADWFLAINGTGELPVIDDSGLRMKHARAILIHLAKTYDVAGTWYPQNDTTMLGQMSMWLSFADALTQTASAARLHDGFLDQHIDVDTARAGAHELLRALDEHLWFSEDDGSGWLCPPAAPTIADLACFPDVMVAEEGGIPLREYRAILRWTDRVKRIPGFAVMPGIFPI